MKIVVTSNGTNGSAEKILDAPASPVFGRCAAYVFVETETMAFEAVENPALAASGGAGIQAAQFVIERGAQAVVTGNMGPNAFNVFQSAGVPVYLFGGGTVREAVEAFKAGELHSIADANVQAGMGVGGGMGRGMGRGMGMGRGATAPPTSAASPPASPEEDIAALKRTAGELQDRLAEVMARLDKLQKED